MNSRILFGKNGSTLLNGKKARAFAGSLWMGVMLVMGVYWLMNADTSAASPPLPPQTQNFNVNMPPDPVAFTPAINAPAAKLHTFAQSTPITATNISSSTIASTQPCLAVNGDNEPYFVWSENGDVYFQELGGQRELVSNIPTGYASGASTNPSVAIDSNGAVHVIWQEDITPYSLIYYKTRTGSGENWTGFKNVTDDIPIPSPEHDIHEATSPRIVSANAVAYIMWVQTYNSGHDTYKVVYRLLQYGAWSTSEEMHSQNGLGYDVTSGENIYFTNDVTYYGDIISYFTWDGTDWAIDNSFSPTGTQSSISQDVNGMLHTSWVYNENIMYSRNSGAGWSAPEVVAGGNSPEITVVGETPVIVWFQNGALVTSQLYNGEWLPPTVVVSSTVAPSGATPCKFIADDAGGLHLAYDASVNGQRDVFYAQPEIQEELPPIYYGQDWNAECPFCSVKNTQGNVGGINPRTGSFGYQETALDVPVAGGELAFKYSYISAGTEMYTATMGAGWVHNYDMQLHISDTVPTHTVIFQAPGGSRFPYTGNGDGTYVRYAGVTADLVREVVGEDVIYTITAENQYQFKFNYLGELTEQIDPAGNSISFTYNSGKLYRATQGSRYLQYEYNAVSGYLEQVTDHNSRLVTVAYTGDDLTSVTAPQGIMTYAYTSSGDHLLASITDPSGTVLKQIAYNDGRAYEATDGQGRVLVEIGYLSPPVNVQMATSSTDLSATAIVTASGVVMTKTYDSRGTLVNTVYSCDDGTAGCEQGAGIGYDGNFKQNDIIDANGNGTQMAWNGGGSNLEGVTDALNNETSFEYDALNNLTQVTDAHGITTTYQYENGTYPTFRTRMTDTSGNETTYIPTTSVDGVGGLLKEEGDANGIVTTYVYNDVGQPIETVRAAGTSDSSTMTYGYDTFGRLITTTQAVDGESHTSLSVYNDSDQIIASINNWTGSDLAAWETACDTSPGPRDSDICTQHEYDPAGRPMTTTNALGQVSLTFYDVAGRVVTSVVNYDGVTAIDQLCLDFNSPDPEYNLCSLTGYDELGRVVTSTNSIGSQNVTEYDSLGRVKRSINNWDDGVFNAVEPDRDIETLYQYDAVGNVIIITDTIGSMSRTFYDELNRTAGTIDNWSGGIAAIENLPDCLTLPAERDYDICTLYQYDEIGNTIIVTDTVGVMNRTFYNTLNQVEATVTNWTVALTSPAMCDVSPTNESVENICTLYGYDDVGNQITTTNALSQTNLIVYDAANRPVIQVTNWDGATITPDGIGCADTVADPQATENLCSTTRYDSFGRRSETEDVMGAVTAFAYDGLGRVITTTQTNEQLPIINEQSYDALGNRLSQTDANGNTTTFSYDSLNRMQTTTSAEGVTISQQYNAAGWVITTTDGLMQDTVTAYDELGRRIRITNAEDNSTQYEYDASGNQTVMIDAESVRTSYLYDDLNRLAGVIENDLPGNNPTDESDLLTEYVYDVVGNRLVITNALHHTSTLTTYDILNRPIIVADALGNEAETSYNALAQRIIITDANDAITTYIYDDLNRPYTVNYLDDGVAVNYTYNARGSRLTMTDDVGVTSYGYDDFNRLITVTNPFSGTIIYGYDNVGNRTHLTYPDGKVVTYTYNMDNRLVQVEGWDNSLTEYGYDIIGRLITTTLPNGVISINQYDDAHRLQRLSHTDIDGNLLADFQYELDSVGNRLMVTETLRLLTDDEVNLMAGLLQSDEAPINALAAAESIYPQSTSDNFPSIPANAGHAENPYPPAPFDVDGVLEQVRNKIKTSANDVFYVEQRGHRVEFSANALSFLVLPPTANQSTTATASTISPTITLTTTYPITEPIALTVELISMESDSISLLYDNADLGSAEMNTYRIERGANVVEEFSALDGGIVQRWSIETPLHGDLAIVVEVETALDLLQSDSDTIFSMSIDNDTDIPIARYSHATVIDANGQSQWVTVDAEKISTSSTGLHRYEIQMTFPITQLETVEYPITVNLLLSSLIVPIEEQNGSSAIHNPNGNPVSEIEITLNTETETAMVVLEQESLLASVAPNIIILQPDAGTGMDTYIDESYPDSSYGGGSGARIGTRGGPSSYYLGGPYRSLLQFDLSSIPNGSIVESAVLEVYAYQYEGTNSFELYRATSAWDENSTWNTTPAYDASTLWGSFSAPTYRQYVKRTIDVSDLINQWHDGIYANYGFYIKGANEYSWTRQWFYTSDGVDASMHPKLVINIVPNSIVLQPDAGTGLDTYIDESYPDNSYGEWSAARIGTRGGPSSSYLGGPYRSLLQFDLSSIPNGSIVESAALEVYAYRYEGTNSFELYRATSAWDENSTWNTTPAYDASTLWGSFTAPTYRQYVKRTIDVSDLISQWHDGIYTNYGFYIKGTNEYSWTRQWFYTSDGVDASMRPKLIVTFSDAPPIDFITNTIHYDYDSLYRLTDAIYTGGVNASYRYVYDAVGNMTTYTETVNSQTESATRAFNAANQLVSTTGDTPAAVFIYDNNGNLSATSGAGGYFEYVYNQRNMLIRQTETANENAFLIAEFVYDGSNNRLQQIDHTGTVPITTTYSNDNMGMSQVLAATTHSTGSGQATTTHNLYGRDLIGQQAGNGEPMRLLLPDGLGSVRQEMVGSSLQTTTTYDPYGNMLAQTGSSGTVYGFTGEQEDSATGLLYLRARYYNPSLMLFMKRDPWGGNTQNPSTLHGYSYVGNNPANHTDPSGLCIMEGTNGGLCPVENDSLFNYQIIKTRQSSHFDLAIPGGIKEYIQVNYNRQPWGDYTTAKTPSGPSMIPIRHSLNLLEEDESCNDSLQSAKDYYRSGGFTTWERYCQMLWIANSKVASAGKFFFELDGKSGKILVLPSGNFTPA